MNIRLQLLEKRLQACRAVDMNEKYFRAPETTSFGCDEWMAAHEALTDYLRSIGSSKDVSIELQRLILED